MWNAFFWRTETQKKVHLIFGAPVKPIVARSSVVLTLVVIDVVAFVVIFLDVVDIIIGR